MGERKEKMGVEGEGLGEQGAPWTRSLILSVRLPSVRQFVVEFVEFVEIVNDSGAYLAWPIRSQAR